MKNILFEVENAIAKITIDRSSALNALNKQTIEELYEVVNEIMKSQFIKVVIITGRGKAFVAGADIKEMQGYSVFEARAFSLLGQKVFSIIENLQQVVIAAVNGVALGGGCELSMACDIRLASSRAKFGQPEVGLGITPGYAGTQRLPRIVGKSQAKELIFTGRIIDVEEAYRIGLVNKIVEHEQLMAEAEKLAKTIASKGYRAVSLAKNAINNGANMSEAVAYQFEAECFSLCFATEDQKEGMDAFIEKRPPNFKGC